MLEEQYGLLEQDPCAVLGSTEVITAALLEAGYRDVQVGEQAVERVQIGVGMGSNRALYGASRVSLQPLNVQFGYCPVHKTLATLIPLTMPLPFKLSHDFSVPAAGCV
jgi:hypothetical protein